MTYRPNRTLRSFARIPRDADVIVHRELVGRAMVTVQCMRM
jgi:hypothetical protein